ncbi:MAG: GNAT family N-acetyltransferase [Pseudomonadota bacterium]
MQTELAAPTITPGQGHENDAVVIRRAAASDFPQIFDFIARTYGSGAAFKDAARLEWQFVRPAFRADQTVAPTLWLAEAGGRVVGTIGVQDSRLKLGSETIPAGWIVDVMVDPAWRGQGLGHKIHDAVMGERMTLVTLTMAPATRRIAEKAGALTLGPTWQFVKPAKLRGPTVSRYLTIKKATRPKLARWIALFIRSRIGPAAVAAAGRLAARIASIRHKRAALTGFDIEEVDWFPDSLDAFWASLKADFPAIFDRSAEALNWRFCQCPGLAYRRFVLRGDGIVRGWLVVRVGVKEELPVGAVVDLLAAPDDQPALDALIALAQETLLPHCEFLEAAASTPAFVAAFKRAGFLQGRVMHPTVVCTSATIRARLEAAKDDWHFTKGDHDWDQVHPA